MSANWESKSLCSPCVEKLEQFTKSNTTLVSLVLPLAVCCVEIVSVLQHAGSWPPVPRENQVPQEMYLHAPPLGPGILQNIKKQNALWYVHVIPASWWGFISNVYFTKTLHSYWSSLLHSLRTLKFLPICGGGCPFLGAGGGGWGGTRYAANSWDLDMMKM